ncbi:MAG: DUF547 domain-containing protein [Oceanibaculum nanhaiense]|jgi:hypothetical protein|uniref:DUF547 domain-containing protein n=1 Tax=Oceanibaculum nanhaiense TaxID=1909734 RepID=UPI0032EC1B2D
MHRLAVTCLFLLLFSLPATAAPEAELWARWTVHNPAATASVDHTAWDAFLKRHLRPGDDGVTRLDYAAAQADAAPLDAYLERLSAVPVSRLNRDEQRAFWINLYNALTVHTVLAHYPVDSIRDIRISPGLFSIGPWGRKLISVEGEPLSLDDIEHRILRPIWRDPRVHYAVNCASIGCPNLLPEAFTAANTERLMEAGAHAYVNHPRGVSLADGRLVISSIYDWFEADFGGGEAGVLAHLRRHAAPELAAALAARREIDDHRYDWTLNDAGR